MERHLRGNRHAVAEVQALMTLCKQSGGLAQNDQWGETHTHVCGDVKRHGGEHSCRLCPYTWRQ